MPKIITQDDTNFLFKRSKKDQNWDTKKLDNQKLEKMFSVLNPNFHREFYERFKKYPERFRGCSDYLAFAVRAELETGLEILKLVDAKFCRIRHCPICQSRLSMRWIAKFHQIMPILLQDHSDTQFILLTLTVPNCEVNDLKKTIQNMNKGWDRLVKRKFFKDKILGFIRSTEVTKNQKNKTAHPHFHVLLHVKNSYFNGRNFITRDDWKKYWCDSVRDQSITQVDVRKIRESKNKTKEENLIGGALEVVKYATKQSNIADDPLWFFQFCVQIDRLRFMSTGGTLRKLIADLDRDDLLNIDDEKTKEENLSEDFGDRIVFTWDRKKHYRRDPDKDYKEDLSKE